MKSLLNEHNVNKNNFELLNSLLLHAFWKVFLHYMRRQKNKKLLHTSEKKYLNNARVDHQCQGRAVDPQTPEHSGVEVSTSELFWGWILFWD